MAVDGTVSCQGTASDIRPTTITVSLSFAPGWSVMTLTDRFTWTGVTHCVTTGAGLGVVWKIRALAAIQGLYPHNRRLERR